MVQKKLVSPKKTFFLLNANVHKLLRKTASAQAISMGEALRQAVQSWLKQKHQKRRSD